MPGHAFSPRGVITATSCPVLRQFFDILHPTLYSHWGLGDVFVQEGVAVAYDSLPLAEREHSFSILEEIDSFSSLDCCSEMILRTFDRAGIALPEGFHNNTIQDKAMWTCIHYPELWNQLIRIASVESESSSLWHAFRVVKDNGPIPEDETPDCEALSKAISKVLFNKDGFQRSARSYYLLSRKTIESYCVEVSKVPKKRTECIQGTFCTEIDHGVDEISYRYDRESQKLEILCNSDLKTKRLLAMAWAAAIKNASIQENEKKTPIYSIDHLKYRDFVYEPDDEGLVESAELANMKFTLLGQPSKEFVYRDSESNVLDNLEHFFNHNKAPISLCIVHSVDIRVRLHSSFGSKKSQTIHISRYSCNVESKNIAVRDILRKCLVRWGIARG